MITTQEWFKFGLPVQVTEADTYLFLNVTFTKRLTTCSIYYLFIYLHGKERGSHMLF